MPPQLGWTPQTTWLFVVGTLEWKHSDSFSSFPTENRRDAALVQFFRDQGVPSEQITYLQDRQATTQKVHQAFETQLKALRKDDLCIVYYCGHGDKTDDAEAYFATYDADGEKNMGWEVKTILPMLTKHLNGGRMLFLIDCCYSGALTESLETYQGKGAFASLTSSLSSELSTGNWTFTESLLYALRGQSFVDGDHDRLITLAELAEDVIQSMAFAEEQVSSFAVRGGFPSDLILAKATSRRDPKLGKRVEAYSDGDWYPAQIIDVKGDEVFVHYYGYEESDREWLTEDYIRDAKRKVYAPGTAVQVKWKNKWYDATVLKGYSGMHYIEYDEFDSEWNEWVDSKRIRLPK